MLGALVLLQHEHRIVLQQGRVRDEGDIEPVAILSEEFCKGLELQVGLLNLRVVHRIARAVLNTGEVAVEGLPTDALANHVEQLAEVLTGTQTTVAAGVNVSEVEHRHGALDVVADLEHLFERAPEFLAATRFDADLGRLIFQDPRQGLVILGVVFVAPDFVHAVDHAGHHVGDALIGFAATTKAEVGSDVVGDVTSVDDLGGLQARLHFGEGALKLAGIAQDLGVVGAVQIHLESGFPRQNTGLPVLVEVMRLDQANGLNFHRFKAKSGDVVHALDDGSTLA